MRIEPAETVELSLGDYEDNLSRPRKSDKPIPRLFGRPVKVKTAEDASKLMTKVISEFQKGTVSNKDAKDCAFLVSAFLSTCKGTEFEHRLDHLEKVIVDCSEK